MITFVNNQKKYKSISIMATKATTVSEYLDEVEDERKEVFTKIFQTIKNNIPEGFDDTIQHGMISFVVPHSIYPDGYHCNKKQALPLMSIASQKNAISLHHMGLYADENLSKWFSEQYIKQCKSKLDMGKGCVRFKKMDDIPFNLIKELVAKINVSDWISTYEKNYKK